MFFSFPAHFHDLVFRNLRHQPFDSDILNNPGINRLLKAGISAAAPLVKSVVVLVSRPPSQRILELLGARHSLISSRQENNLAVRTLGHGLHRLQVANLHGRGGRQDISRLPHQLGSLDLCLGGNDLAFTDPLGLGGHGKRFLEFVAEDDVLDEHALHLDTPAGGDVFDDFPDGLGEFLAALDDVLEDAGADHVAEGGLGALDEGLADVGDAEGGLVGGYDVVVDDRGEVDTDVVFGHADLLGDFDDLDLDVDLDEVLGQGVDFDETGVDSLVELAELGDETDVALADGFVWVGAADAAWDCTEGADESTDAVN